METNAITNIDRNEKGQFVTGNKAGRGRPIGSRVDMLRRALIEAVTVEDISEIIRGLIEQAKAGNLTAAKIVFDRVLGGAINIDILERHGLPTMEDSERERDIAEKRREFFDSVHSDSPISFLY